mmetsp:Transcript_72977/g.217798  ORF Transcript_72977/g.217798 Transcript_72977/m.217798 type:complete len:230 (+) Transcript_72977:114-803(+)
MILLRLSSAVRLASSLLKSSFAALRSMAVRDRVVLAGEMVSTDVKVQGGGAGGVVAAGGCSCTHGGRISLTARLPVATADMPGVVATLQRTVPANPLALHRASRTSSASAPSWGETVTWTLTELEGPALNTRATCEGCTCVPTSCEIASLSSASRAPTSEGVWESQMKSTFWSTSVKQTQGSPGSGSGGGAGCAKRSTSIGTAGSAAEGAWGPGAAAHTLWALLTPPFD